MSLFPCSTESFVPLLWLSYGNSIATFYWLSQRSAATILSRCQVKRARWTGSLLAAFNFNGARELFVCLFVYNMTPRADAKSKFAILIKLCSVGARESLVFLINRISKEDALSAHTAFVPCTQQQQHFYGTIWICRHPPFATMICEKIYDLLGHKNKKSRMNNNSESTNRNARKLLLVFSWTNTWWMCNFLS